METIELDILITRLLDGRAGDADWQVFRNEATTNAAVWTELAEAQRQTRLVGEAVRGAVACAEYVDAGGRDGVRAGVVVVESRKRETRNEQSWRGEGRTIAIRPWIGWAAAAVLALGWYTQYQVPNGGRLAGNQANLVSLPTFSDSDEAMQAYLDVGKKTGRVVGELPERRVVETRPLLVSTGTDANGQKGYEVFYLRQVIERAVVPDLYRLGADEAGQPVLIPTNDGRGRRAGGL